MFDISFIELLVIFVVALLVLGPEKLPGAVRTGALWLGRAKRSFNKVKTEIEQQLNTDDIRRQLHNESILEDIEKARKSADKLIKDAQMDLDKTQDDINQAVSSAKPPPVAVVSSSAIEGIPTGTDEWPDKTATQTADAVADPAGTENSTEPETAEPPKAPIQDFYNNPPAGLVAVQGGKMVAVDSAPSKDSSGQKG